MDHGLETHVDLAAADDLGDIGGVVGLQQSNLQVFLFKEAFALGKIQRGMVGRRVP